MQQLKPRKLDMVDFDILVNYFNVIIELSDKDLLICSSSI